MKLEKKTIYKVDSKEKFNAMMRDANTQGFYWTKKGDAEHRPDNWNVYEEDTHVRISSDGYMMYGPSSAYEDAHLDHARKEYKNTHEVFSCLGGLCVDAPDFNTAYKIFKEHINRIGALPIQTNVYTVRVEDDNTTVITPEGKMATAKCHPDDEFDVVEGFRVALEKIKERERKLTKEEYKILRALEVLGCDTFEIKKEFELTGFSDGIYACDIDIEDEFSWLNSDETYNTKEILEKYA